MTTKMIGGKDRTDYRAMTNRELVEEAKYTPNIELCIALGERLQDMQRKLDGWRYDYEAERRDYEY